MVGSNFKNTSKTVSERHQYHMCLKMLSPPGSTCNSFLYSGDSIGRGENTFSLNDDVLDNSYDNCCPVEFVRMDCLAMPPSHVVMETFAGKVNSTG